MEGRGEPLILAVDLGTTWCKAALIKKTGAIAAQSSAAMPPCRDAADPDAAVTDPDAFWAVFVEVVQGLPHKLRTASAALVLTGQTRGQIVMDRSGIALLPAILWQDSRSKHYSARLQAKFSPAEIRQFLGHSYPLSASTWPVRLSWLCGDYPQIMEHAAQVLQPKDYINYRLTGISASDTSNGLGFLHWPDRTVAASFLKALQIPVDIVPPVLDSHEGAGVVTAASAAELGLPSGLPVTAGAMDSWCDFLGVGLTKAGQAVDIGGTSEVVGLLGRGFSELSGLVEMPFLETLYFAGGPLQNGGSCYQWMETVCPAADGAGAAAAQQPWLFFVPFLRGERTPYTKPDSRAAFFGLDSSHTAADLQWAVMAGVAASIRDVLSRAEQAGDTACRELKCAGGASQNRAWNQLKADMLGVPVRTGTIHETALVGAAALAAVNIGWFSDLEECVRTWVPEGDIVEPTVHRGWYDSYFQAYLRAVEAVFFWERNPGSDPVTGQS